MADAPTIPFGYRQIQGPSQKGDGIWDGECFRKVRKQYPFAGDSGAVIIRRQEVQQEALPMVVGEDCEIMEM